MIILGGAITTLEIWAAPDGWLVYPLLGCCIQLQKIGLASPEFQHVSGMLNAAVLCFPMLFALKIGSLLPREVWLLHPGVWLVLPRRMVYPLRRSAQVPWRFSIWFQHHEQLVNRGQWRGFCDGHSLVLTASLPFWSGGNLWRPSCQ